MPVSSGTCPKGLHNEGASRDTRIVDDYTGELAKTLFSFPDTQLLTAPGDIESHWEKTHRLTRAPRCCPHRHRRRSIHVLVVQACGNYVDVPTDH